MPIDGIPKAAGMIYALVSFILIVVLMRRGHFSRKIGLVFLMVSGLVGFLILAPMLPLQFQTLVTRDPGSLGGPLPMIIGVLALFLVLTYIFGRVFCGYICPIGALQELAFNIPGKKITLRPKYLPLVVQTVLFLAILVLGLVFTNSILEYAGAGAFFGLAVTSVLFFVFLGILVLSIFLYRPYCRLICPYGLLLSLASTRSLNRLFRTTSCVECGRCDKICPTGQGTSGASRRDCTLCGRCVETCRVQGLEYGFVTPAGRKKPGTRVRK